MRLVAGGLAVGGSCCEIDPKITLSMMLLPFLHIFAILIQKASSNDNGLAQTPPMGWRSWKQYHGDVDQSLMQQIMEGMVDRGGADHANQPTSLCDLGYCDVGLDNNWQACGSPEAATEMNYNDINGNPIVNLKDISKSSADDGFCSFPLFDAVLLLNSSTEATTLTVVFSSIPGASCNPCKVRNIWEHQDEGEFVHSWSTIVESRDAAFIVLE